MPLLKNVVLGSLDLPSLLLAFTITLVEMTEVVALIFAVGAEGGALRPAAVGAIAGTATVTALAITAGAALERVPPDILLWGAAAVLLGFGLFLLRSTVRTYRRLLHPGATAAHLSDGTLPFTAGFAAGGVEAVETVVVLIALAAGGHGLSAIVGALAGGGVLVVGAALVHERIRRIKIPTLKLGATSALFSFAGFWGSEAAGIAWPGPPAWRDLYLLPIFALVFLAVRAVVRWRAGRALPAEAKG